MNKELVLDISDTGVEGMHFDWFNLGFLGKMNVIRASEIFFNADAQEWDIQLPGQEEPYRSAMGFSSYEEARAFEVEWLQTCRKFHINPLSDAGAGICAACRYAE